MWRAQVVEDFPIVVCPYELFGLAAEHSYELGRLPLVVRAYRGLGFARGGDGEQGGDEQGEEKGFHIYHVD